MSRISLSGDVSGTGTITIAAPNTNTSRTLNLPDASGTIFTDGSTLGVSQLPAQLSVSGSAAAGSLVLDSAGRVSTPYQPAFLTGFNGFSTGTTAAIIPAGGVVSYNVGNHYNSTTRQFTAPVAGMYIAYASFLRNPSAIVLRGGFYVNGVSRPSQMRTSEGYSGYNLTATFMTILSLQANDVLDFRISSDSAASVYTDGGTGVYNYFGGVLLG